MRNADYRSTKGLAKNERSEPGEISTLGVILKLYVLADLFVQLSISDVLAQLV